MRMKKVRPRWVAQGTTDWVIREEGDVKEEDGEGREKRRHRRKEKVRERARVDAQAWDRLSQEEKKNWVRRRGLRYLDLHGY